MYTRTSRNTKISTNCSKQCRFQTSQKRRFNGPITANLLSRPLSFPFHGPMSIVSEIWAVKGWRSVRFLADILAENDLLGWPESSLIHNEDFVYIWRNFHSETLKACSVFDSDLRKYLRSLISECPIATWSSRLDSCGAKEREQTWSS